jgi:hypothetical protein
MRKTYQKRQWPVAMPFTPAMRAAFTKAKEAEAAATMLAHPGAGANLALAIDAFYLCI